MQDCGSNERLPAIAVIMISVRRAYVERERPPSRPLSQVLFL